MIQTITLSDFRDAFKRMGRADQFSYEGLELIFDYIESYEQDSGEQVELDVIALCCEWTEDTAEEVINNYATGIDPEGMDEDEIRQQVEDFLLDETQYAGQTPAGTFVYVQF